MKGHLLIYMQSVLIDLKYHFNTESYKNVPTKAKQDYPFRKSCVCLFA